MKIIKHGNSWREATCHNCGAVLAYSKADIKTKERVVGQTLRPGKLDTTVYYIIKYIECPECGERIILSDSEETITSESLIGNLY